MSKIIKIKALKYPTIPHYEWEGELIEATNDHVIVQCKPGRKLIHHTKNSVFTLDNTTIEYFSLTDWFTVSTQINNGKAHSYYCNVAKPSIFKNDEITFVDLDLDLVKRWYGDWEVVDEDEFAENSLKYNYPHDLKQGAIDALERLKEKAINGLYPFDNELLKKVV